MKECVSTECDECGGTGLVPILHRDQEENAVICSACKGTGCRVVRYNSFVRRKGRRGITKVYATEWPSPTCKVITYQEFQQGKLP
jgi:hypothetical protein